MTLLALHLLQVSMVYTFSIDVSGDLGILQADRLMAFQVSQESGVVRGLSPLIPKHWKAFTRSLR